MFLTEDGTRPAIFPTTMQRSDPTISANPVISRKPLPSVIDPPEPLPSIIEPSTSQACTECGAALNIQSTKSIHEHTRAPSPDAQRTIGELQAEVQFLTGKATSAADKLADYEDEIRQLKSQPGPAETPERAGSPEVSSPASQASAAEMSATQPVRPSTAGALSRTLTTTRISNFLAARRFSPLPSTGSPLSDTPDVSIPELTARLAQEQSARQSAENKLAQTNTELEELSVSLFQQANTMVAEERRARAASEQKAADRSKALEDKVRRLEGKISRLEAREIEKNKRLDRLEAAMKRVQRVKGLLAPMG